MAFQFLKTDFRRDLGRALWQTGAVILFLYFVSLYNFILFRFLIELFSLVILLSIFIVAWNSRKLEEDAFTLFIGIAFLFVGLFDLLHLIARPESGLLKGASVNLAQQAKMAERYLEALSFLSAFLWVRKRPRPRLVFLSYLVVFVFLLLAIFHWRIFPTVYLTGIGLTSFGSGSVYGAIFLLLFSLAVLVGRRSNFDLSVYSLLFLSLVFKIFNIAISAPYLGGYSAASFISYAFRFASFFFLYKAVIEIGLNSPYRLLFRNLKASEASLKKARDGLERTVADRTAALVASNQALQKEIVRRKETEKDLIEYYKHLGFINRRVSLLLDLNRHLYKRKRKEIFGYILDSAVSLSKASVGILYLRSNNVFYSVRVSGLKHEDRKRARVISGEACGFLRRFTSEKILLRGLVRNFELGVLDFYTGRGYFIALPFVVSRQLKGFLFLSFRDRIGMDSQEMEFLDVFATNATLALFNAGILK